MSFELPTAIIIVLAVAAVLVLFSVIDKSKAGGGNPLKQKNWLRTAMIMVVISLFVLVTSSLT